MTREQLRIEQAVERYVLFCAQLIFVALAAAGITAGNWVLVGVGLAATFINWRIGTGLPKNRDKSFLALGRGRASDPSAVDLVGARPGRIETHGATSASVKCGSLCAVVVGIIAWMLGLGPWQIGVAMLIAFLIVLAWGFGVMVNTAV
jgi:hypothetical protein